MSKKYSELIKAAMENFTGLIPASLKKGLMYFNADTDRPMLDDGSNVSQLMLEKHLPEARRTTKVQLTEDVNVEVEGTLTHTKGGTGLSTLAGGSRKALIVKELEDGFEFGEAGGGAVFETNQVSHGFNVPDPIYHNGTDWQLAQANAADTLAEYVVVEVFDDDNFKAAKFGKFDIVLPSPSFGGVYYNDITATLRLSKDGVDIVPDIDGNTSYNPEHITLIKGKVYFSANAGSGEKLYIYDPATSSTSLAFNDIGGNANYQPQYFEYSPLTDKVYFKAFDGSSFSVLFEWDMVAAAPTVVFASIDGLVNYTPNYLNIINNELYFTAGIFSSEKLYKWDFISASPQLLFNDVGGQTDYAERAFPSFANGELYFWCKDASNNFKLYSWDFVAASPTEVFADISGTTSYGQNVGQVEEIGGVLYFTALVGGFSRRLYSWDFLAAQPTLLFSSLDGDTNYNIVTSSNRKIIYEDPSNGDVIFSASVGGPAGSVKTFRYDSVSVTEIGTSGYWPAYATNTPLAIDAGEHYYLSQAETGAYTAEEPTSGYSAPLFYAEDANTIHVEVYRPSIIGDGIVSDSEIGSIMAFGNVATPVGFLYCNGQEVSRVTYGELFAAIGTNFGVGDGSTTFNLPDLRGEFLRGIDDGRGVDTDGAARTIGGTQDDAFQGHWHTGNGAGSNEFLYNRGTGGVYSITGGTVVDRTTIPAGNATSDGVNGTPRTSDETRPRNVGVKYYIRYAAKGAVEAENKVNPTVVIPAIETNIDWQSGEVFAEILSADKTYTFSNQQDGKTIVVVINNIDTVDHTINFPSANWANTTVVNIVPANSTTAFTFVDVAGNLLASAVEGLG